jgi:hypothetical protein
MAQCFTQGINPMDELILKRILFGDHEIDNPTGIMATNHVRYQVDRQFSPAELKEMDDVMSYYETINRLSKKMEARK